MRTPTRTSISTPTQVPALCSCAGNLYNCSDFPTQAAALACCLYCIQLGYGDIHRLGGDNDGIACEALP